MKTLSRYRRGDTSPLRPGLVFARYSERGKEIWFTPERLEASRAEIKARRQREALEVKHRPLRRGDTSPLYPRRIFHSYQYGRELWVTPERFVAMKNAATLNDKRSLERRRLNPAFRAKEKSVTIAYWKRKRQHINKVTRDRRQNNIEAKIASRLRCRIRDAVVRQGAIKCVSTAELIGCSIHALRDHIETHFTDGMCWGRIAEIDIDHTLPLSMFDLKNPAQQRIACNFKNLRPMWSTQNKSKNDKIEVNGVLVRVHDLKKRNIIPFQEVA